MHFLLKVIQYANTFEKRVENMESRKTSENSLLSGYNYHCKIDENIIFTMYITWHEHMAKTRVCVCKKFKIFVLIKK